MGALVVLWLRPVPAEMALFFTGPNTQKHKSQQKKILAPYHALIERRDTEFSGF
jgi:hypothetical protein